MNSVTLPKIFRMSRRLFVRNPIGATTEASVLKFQEASRSWVWSRSLRGQAADGRVPCPQLAVAIFAPSLKDDWSRFAKTLARSTTGSK